MRSKSKSPLPNPAGAHRWVFGALLLALGEGCAKPPCEETLTCPRANDGAQGGTGNTAGTGGGGAAGQMVNTAGHGDDTAGKSASAGSGGLGVGGTAGRESDAGEAGEAGAGSMPDQACEPRCDDGEAANGQEQCVRGKCVPGNAPPAVVSVAPAEGATDADPAGTIRITFSEELDPATVTKDAVAVFKDNEPIPGSVTYSGTRVTVTPDTNLGLVTRYTVSVKASVADVDGVTMLKDFSSTFAVRDGAWTQAKPASMSDGNLVGVSADAAGNYTLGYIADIPSARHYRLGAWSAPEQTLTCTDCYRYTVSGNRRGEAIAVAVDFDGTAVARQYRGGEWQPEDATVAQLTEYIPQAEISAAVAPTGEAYAAFVDGHTIRTRHTDNAGFWSGSTDNPITETVLGTPKLGFDDSGQGFVAWVALDADTNSSALRFVQLHGGTAGSVKTISSSLSNDSIASMALAVAPSGTAMALWRTENGLLTSFYADQWGPSQEVKSSTDVPLCGDASLVSDGEDFVAAWLHRSGDEATPCLVYTSRWHEGTWDDPELRSDATKSVDNGAPPVVGADSNGNLMLLWTVQNQANYARYNHVAATWSSPKKAFDATVTSAFDLAVSDGGPLIAAFNSGSSVYAALYQ